MSPAVIFQQWQTRHDTCKCWCDGKRNSNLFLVVIALHNSYDANSVVQQYMYLQCDVMTEKLHIFTDLHFVCLESFQLVLILETSVTFCFVQRIIGNCNLQCLLLTFAQVFLIEQKQKSFNLAWIHVYIFHNSNQEYWALHKNQRLHSSYIKKKKNWFLGRREKMQFKPIQSYYHKEKAGTKTSGAETRPILSKGPMAESFKLNVDFIKYSLSSNNQSLMV